MWRTRCPINTCAGDNTAQLTERYTHTHTYNTQHQYCSTLCLCVGGVCVQACGSVLRTECSSVLIQWKSTNNTTTSTAGNYTNTHTASVRLNWTWRRTCVCVLQMRVCLREMCVLYVGPLPSDTTEKQIHKLFRHCGRVRTVRFLHKTHGVRTHTHTHNDSSHVYEEQMCVVVCVCSFTLRLCLIILKELSWLSIIWTNITSVTVTSRSHHRTTHSSLVPRGGCVTHVCVFV